jgi:hypothetical protein
VTISFDFPMEPLGFSSAQQASAQESAMLGASALPQQSFKQESSFAFELVLRQLLSDRGCVFAAKVLVLAPVAQQEWTEARGTDWEGLLKERFLSIDGRS